MKGLAVAAVAAVLICSQTIDGQSVRANSVQIEAPPLSFTRITVGLNGEPSNGNSTGPSMSANGRFVAYTSEATNLVSGDTNGKRDVFVYDRRTGRTTVDSVTSSGGAANDSSDFPSISDDGRYVVFTSYATNLVGGAGSGHLYLRDRVLGTTTLVDRTLAGAVDNASYPSRAAMNDDGRYIAFSSSAAGIVADDTNGCADVFVRDVLTGLTERVSVDGGLCGGEYPSISADGRHVAFQSGVRGSSERFPNHGIFVRDRIARTTSHESNESDAFLDGSNQPSLSGDGRFLSWYRTKIDTPAVDGMYVRDRVAGLTIGPLASRSGEDSRNFMRMGRTPYASTISAFPFFVDVSPEAYLFEITTGGFIPIAPGSYVSGISAVAGDGVALASSVALVPAPTSYATDIYLVTIPYGTPGVPRNLAWSIAGSSITLTWAAPAAGDPPSEYVIAAGSQPGRTDDAILATGSTSTTFSAAVPAGGTYYVRVHARNASGTGGPSNEIRLTVGSDRRLSFDLVATPVDRP